MQTLRLVTAISFLFLCASVMAQTGGITGTVTDQIGAVIPNVQITARNLATNEARVAISSDVGTYSITNLPPARYEVTFDKSGFKVLKYSNVVVTVSEVLPMPVGNLSSPLFGYSTSIHGYGHGSASATRTIDFQLRFSF